jgi:signal peptidase II
MGPLPGAVPGPSGEAAAKAPLASTVPASTVPTSTAADEPVKEKETAGWGGKQLAFVIAAVIIAVDLWSKSAVFARLADGEHVWIAREWFGLTPVRNPGIMWGALPQFKDFLPWMRVLAAVVVVIMLRGAPRHALRLQIALGLVLGGAIGNIYDGFKVGQVRDFLLVDLGFRPFAPFPVFNIADSAICVGVGLLALGLLLDRPEDGATA